MNANQQEVLRAKVNMETSRIHWKELQRFFAQGLVVEVSKKLDLVDVAFQMQQDNKSQFENWLAEGLIYKLADEQAALCMANETEVWAVVVSPWVLVQAISAPIPH